MVSAALAGRLGMGTVANKKQAHELIERLPDSEIPTAVRFLEFILLDPLARAAAVREPVEDDLRRLQESEAWFAQRGGKGIPMEDVLADFGLKMDDFPTGR